MPIPKNLFEKNPKPVQPVQPAQQEEPEQQAPIPAPNVSVPKRVVVANKIAAGQVPQPDTAQTSLPEAPGAVTAPAVQASVPKPAAGGSPRKVTDIYNSVSSKENNLLNLDTSYSTSRKSELWDVYNQQVKPAYEAYKKAEEGLKNGTVSQAEYDAARRQYSFVYNQTSPLWDAYKTLRDADNTSGFQNSSSEDIGTQLDRWNTAYDEAVSSLEQSGAKLGQMQTQYEAQAQAYADAMKQFETDVAAFNSNKKRTKEQLAELTERAAKLDEQLKELNALEDEYSRAAGEYRAQSWYLGDMEYVLGAGLESWKKKYIEENPWYIWAQNEGAKYDENGRMISITSKFNDLYDHVQELNELAKTQTGEEQQKTYEEMAYYYGLMNTGLALANMSSDEVAESRKFFQDKVDALNTELQNYAHIESILYGQSSSEIQKAPEGWDYERDFEADLARYNELKNQVADAQSWIQKIDSSEYENVYSEVISGLSQKTQDLVNDYILQTADPQAAAEAQYGEYAQNPALYVATMTPITGGVNFNQGYTDPLKARLDLEDALKKEGLTSDQVAGIMRYVQYEANATRMDLYAKNLAEDAAEANTLSNYLNQLFLGLGSGTGAIDLAVQGAWETLKASTGSDYAKLGREDLQQSLLDPYLGKAAPLDYNTFSNLGTVGAQAIGQGEYQHIFDEMMEKYGSDKEKAEKIAQRWYNVYNLAESMGQSTLIGLMGGAGFKQSLLLLSGSAASQTMRDMHEQGYSDAASVVGGLMSGFAEYITEKVSLENLLSTFNRANFAGLSKAQIAKSLGINVLMQTIAEGSEEGASDLLNTLYDEVIGRLMNGGVSQIEMSALKAQQENPGMSWDEALEGAWKDWTTQLKDDMIAGALSGGLMGGGGYAIGYAGGTAQAYKTGREVIKQGNQYALADAARQAAERISAKAVELNPNIDLNNPLQVGRLLNGYARTAYLDMINERLTELGEENITPELLRAVNNAAAGDHLLPNERAALANSKYGSQALSELKAFNDALLRAQETGEDVDLEGVEDWAIPTNGVEDSLLSTYTESDEAAQQYGARRMNEVELRYRATQEANPGATVLTPTADSLTNAGADAQTAQKQGALLDRVFDGENLKGRDLVDLDLNNKAVRKVFVERTGLTGIPDGPISSKLKAAYVTQVASESRAVKARQADIARGAEMLRTAANDEAKARAEAFMKQAQEAPRNPYVEKAKKHGITDKNGKPKPVGTRGKNAEARTERGEQSFEELRRKEARKKPIQTQGRRATDIINEVRLRSGNSRLAGIGAFEQSMAAQGVTFASAQELDTAYRMYLEENGLTKAEIDAVVAAASMRNGGNTNGIRSGTGERTVSSDGRKGAGGIREASESTSGRRGTSFELGIPTGAEQGNLTEVSTEEVEKSERMTSAKQLLTDAGISAENVHFVRGNGEFIMIKTKAGAVIPVRGVYDPATQSVWILADDSSVARLTPKQIAKHELFHHYVKVLPKLFQQVKASMKANKVLEAAEKIASERYAAGANVYGEGLDRYLEEVMGDAYANVNTFTGADAKQFSRLIRACVNDALMKSPADVIATDALLTEPRTSAIEIPEADKDSHHDNLGRKLSKQMDEYMRNSYMRIDNSLSKPLMVMYQGGRLGYLTFPSGRFTFWSDRAEVSRTYSQGKYDDHVTTTHAQEHTKARKKIAELEEEYEAKSLLASYGDKDAEAALARIDEELRKQHAEVEPFAKDIYAPSKDREVFPQEPKTIEDAKKLINRYGAYNRAAKLVDVKAEDALSLLLGDDVQNFEDAVFQLLPTLDMLYQEAEASMSEVDEVEEQLGEPWWTQDEGIEDLPPPPFGETSRGSLLDEIAELRSLAAEAVASALDYDSTKSVSDAYNMFEALSEIAGSDLDGIMDYAYGFGSDFTASKELLSRLRNFRQADVKVNWETAASYARATYQLSENKDASFTGLQVSGMGLKKVFPSEQDIIKYATELYESIGDRGIYSCYLNITHPLIVDCRGLSFTSLNKLSVKEFPEKEMIQQWKEEKFGYFSTSIRSRDVARWASEQVDRDTGELLYDGVILLNSKDTFGGYGTSTIGGDPSSTVAITWQSWTPKSTANATPTYDERITYSAVEDTDAAVAKAMHEVEWSHNRSSELNSVIQRLNALENVSDEELYAVPEIAEAEKKSTRDIEVPEQPEWANEREIVKQNFLSLGSYNSDSEGSGIDKWNGPVDHDRMAFLVIGPPAAGKSTIAVNELSEANHARIIDKDEYRRFFTGNKNNEDASFVESPSSATRKAIYKHAVSNGENFVWPLVGRGDSVRKNAIALNAAGYKVYLVYVEVNENASLSRVLTRAFPSDGSKGRYTNISYARSAATEPGANFASLISEKFADGTPIIAGSAKFDNSVLGRNAVLVGENTVPNLRTNKQTTKKGADNDGRGTQTEQHQGYGERTGSQPGSRAESLRDNRGSVGSVSDADRLAGRVPGVLGPGGTSESRGNSESSARTSAVESKVSGTEAKKAVRKAESAAKTAQAKQAKAEAKLKAAKTEQNAQAALRKAQKQEQTKRINDALKRNRAGIQVGTNSDLSGAIDYALQKARADKLKAIEQANIDKQWAVKMAESNGEQEVKRLQRFWQDKFDYATKTDKQWARGLKSSTERSTRAEGRRRTKEAVTLDRKIHSLPATTAASYRKSYNKASQMTINDDQAIATPLPFANEYDKDMPGIATRAKQAFMKGYDAAYRAMVNAEQELDRMAKLQTRTDDLSTWINVVRASKSMPNQFYEYGLLNKKGDIIGPSMREVFLCQDENGNIDQKMQNALNDYMFHKHNIDRMSLKSRAMERVAAFEAQYPWLADMPDNEFRVLVADENPIALEYTRLLKAAKEAVDKPVLPDVDGKPVTAATSQKVVDVYETEMPWLIEKAETIYDWWNIFMEEWAVGTSITEEQYQQMREIYPHYVPTYRAKSAKHAGYISANATGLSAGEMTKKAKGSVAELQPMEDQFVQSLNQIVRNNRQNDLLRNLVEELLFDDEGVFSNFGVFDWANASPALKQDLWDFADETEKTAVEKVKINGEDAYHVSCWVDGVKMSAYVNRAMFEGLNFLFDRTSDFQKKAVKAGTFLTKPMKSMITGHNPFFALKNVIRDQHTAFSNSQSGLAYGKYLGQAAAKIAANHDDWVNFQALGGVSSTFHRMEGGFSQEMQKREGVVKKIGNLLSTPGDISESVSRFAEYLATLDRLGGDTYENRLRAIRDAAEVTVDFGRSGSWGKVINAWVPYWNPSVQGLDKAIRNIATQPNVKEMAKRLGRVAFVNTLVVGLQYALLTARGRWKEYEELSDRVKDQYYCFPIGDHKFLKLPKSQDWAAFIATPIMRVMEGAHGRDDPMEGWFESALIPMMPFEMRDVFGIGKEVPAIIPVFYSQMLDLKENKNYAGGAIIPYHLQDVSPKEQFDADTSVFAYYFGQIFNASPMAVDYIIDDYMGNFWGTVAHAIPFISPLSPVGYYSGETKFSDKVLDAAQTILSPFVSDNRYSNSTMANYYSMLDELEQEVIDAGAHGDKTKAEHYELYMALTQSGGYVDQIKALTAKAREYTRGEEQAAIKEAAAGTADLAMEFVEKYLAGEIEDPRLWMTYQGYGEKILHEAEALKKYSEEFNFGGNLGKPTVFYDRTGDVDIKYDLKELGGEWQDTYVKIREDAYRDALNTVISSSKYQAAKPVDKAAMLEEAKREALKKAETSFAQALRKANVKGESVGKTDYSEAQRAAAYSVSWLLGSSKAYEPKITDELLNLYDYHDSYQFMPADTNRSTFNVQDQDKNVLIYTLNKEQKQKYSELYHKAITDYYTEVISSSEYQAAGTEKRAAMLARAKTYAQEDLNQAFGDWLRDTGATPTAKDKADEVISLEAKYAIQRILGDDHAMKQEVTDELIRLYAYVDAGDQSYLPIDQAPKSYVDDRNKKYRWDLTDEQREVYMGMMFDIYQTDVQKVMGSSAYKNASDYEKALMLSDVRSRLAAKVQAQFKKWLRDTNAPRTLRSSSETKQTEKNIAAAGKTVDSILGKARKYKEFYRLLSGKKN